MNRLSYIGSKFQLIEWIDETIKQKTGLGSFKGKIIADLFAGTGVVSNYFRNLGAVVLSNDAELYSSVITHAVTCSEYNENCARVIRDLQTDKGTRVGFVTKNYSPHGESERMFFTVENAMRIDYMRWRLESMKENLNENDFKFLLASLILSSDAVSNVPAVYGCYLKNFKAKANKSIELKPIHTNAEPADKNSKTLNQDVMNLDNLSADIVYLDPPYNERQYSKNYFPLNIIAGSPYTNVTLKGKTGIPEDCFLSSFCRKKEVEESIKKLFQKLKASWVFLSYSSESLVSRDRMVEILEKFGKVSIVERDYKRFKSFEYNETASI